MDGISHPIIKGIVGYISGPPSVLFNEEKNVLGCWNYMYVNVFPLFKKGERGFPNKCRSVSLLKLFFLTA